MWRGGWGVEGHDLCLEGQLRRDGCEPGTEAEAVAGRELAAAEARGGPEPGQGSAAVGDPKKCMVRRLFASDRLSVKGLRNSLWGR
jgi:hypothetical protein